MAKIIAWLILIFVVLLALRMINLRNARAQRKSGNMSSSGNAAPGAGAKPGAEPMVRCVRCGVYLPRAEARKASGGYVCAADGCAEQP
jgi:uncharacterized protein